MKRIVHNIEKDTDPDTGASKVFHTNVPVNCLEDLYWFGEIPKTKEERRALVQRKREEANARIAGIMGYSSSQSKLHRPRLKNKSTKQIKY